jgi:hypothetical protein
MALLAPVEEPPTASSADSRGAATRLLVVRDERHRVARSFQRWLGHRSITSTAVYTALASNRFKDFWRE